MQTPVLLILFNRPDTTARVLERIREARPKRLFVAADGPRENHPGEAEACTEARRIVDEGIDWPCQVDRRYQDRNLGCRQAVAGAITWFFAHVEEGIILEDDCLPDPTFFPFCTELLDRYRKDRRVVCVTGNNHQRGQRRGEASYYFSVFNHCWGWASWRRAWALYDADFSQLDEATIDQALEATFCEPWVRDSFRSYFVSVKSGEVDTWDYLWTLCAWANSGLTATPNGNLVSNIGFDERATHTTQLSSMANLPTEPMELPLMHPRFVLRDAEADHFAVHKCFGITKPEPKRTGLRKFFWKLRRSIRKRLGKPV